MPATLRRLLGYVVPLAVLLGALAAIVAAGLPLTRVRIDVEGVPVEVMARRDRPGGPAVVIAHGFAGSRQIMYAYGYTLAHHGYTVYLLDFAGHGANRQPLDYGTSGLSSDLLQANLDAVVRYAATRHPAVALLGHSMGGGAVTRYGATHPKVAATIAISPAPSAVTPQLPRNYLVMAGAWEFPSFRVGALQLLQRAGGQAPGVLYGDPRRGTARELFFVPAAEHVLILFSPRALAEAVRWLDSVFGAQAASHYIDARLAWLALAFVAALALARPLARRLLAENAAAGTLKALALGPTIALFAVAAAGASFIARVVPSDWPPLAVAGYLANYWAAFGVLTLAGAWLLGLARSWPLGEWINRRAALATLGLGAYLVMAFAVPAHLVASPLVPAGARLPWFFAFLPGTLLYAASGELLIRAQGSGRAELAAELAHKGLTLLSLTGAIFLLGAPFFLALLLPVMALLFVAFALLNHWTYRAGHNPLIGAVLTALSTATIMASIFPLIR